MHIEDLVNQLEALFNMPEDCFKAHLSFLETSVVWKERTYIKVVNKAKSLHARGKAIRLDRCEIRTLREYPKQLSDDKLLIRAIKEGMAYRSMA
jgi:hypothetical protein